VTSAQVRARTLPCTIDAQLCVRSASGVAMQSVTPAARELPVQAEGPVVRVLVRILIGRGQGEPPAWIWRMVSP
jgi:hypothetical protein